ncbi:MAG: hypothetical protein Q4D06_04410 [Coriobacteriia bacterium]|nr:hypothetical protein [Coriobacteriia bacterium]
MAMQQDYLMRYIQQFVEALMRSTTRIEEQEDYEGAARSLDNAVGNAAEMDTDVLLGFAPESIASIVSVMGIDPRLVEYMARSLVLAGDYYGRAGDMDTSILRVQQGQALADAFGIDLDRPWEVLEEGAEVPRVAEPGAFLDD